jgi:2-polyprenyl-3-methyl-5-hydroxy-6-metoxy-1,4-benzoquinol methylase
MTSPASSSSIEYNLSASENHLMKHEQNPSKAYAEKQASYYAADRGEMLTYIPSSVKRVLEVGCGNGAFGQQIKQAYACEVWGIEPFKAAADQAEQKLDRTFCAFYTKDLDLPKAYFDCVVFNDVLEHLVDPYSALEFTKNLLAPQGLVVASIPNIRYFPVIWDLVINKQWKYEASGILDKTHLRFFTCVSIRETFTSLGYETLTLEGINPLNGHTIYRLVSALLQDQVKDMQYPQFAIVAKPMKV